LTPKPKSETQASSNQFGKEKLQGPRRTKRDNVSEKDANGGGEKNNTDPIENVAQTPPAVCPSARRPANEEAPRKKWPAKWHQPSGELKQSLVP